MTIRKLGEVCTVTTGQSAPQDAEAFGSVGYPFIRAGSLESLLSGRLENELELISEKSADKFRLKLFGPDTILFAKSGMSAKLGRVYRTKTPCYVVSHLAAISPGKEVDPGYLHRWFQVNSPSRSLSDNKLGRLIL